LYPVEGEDGITGLLVDLLAVQHHGYHASERLRGMILREPRRAGILVRALRDDGQRAERDYAIGEVLAHVSGYSNTWCVWVPPGEEPVVFRNDFWRAWWRRNSGREVFDWQVETLCSDPKNSARKKQALQVLGHLGDRRAKCHFVAALDDDSDGVRYWAVVGLRKLDGTYDRGGYKWETYKEEEQQVIQELKQRHSLSP
jgi:hypothetical protein